MSLQLIFAVQWAVSTNFSEFKGAKGKLLCWNTVLGACLDGKLE